MTPARRHLLLQGLAALCLVAVPFVLPLLGAAPNTVNRILVWGLFGLGFDILFGYTGLLSFGQSAFYGTGGFVAAYLLTRAGFPNVMIALVIAVAAFFFAADLAAWHAGIHLTKLGNATLFGNVASFAFAAWGLLLARRWPTWGSTPSGSRWTGSAT